MGGKIDPCNWVGIKFGIESDDWREKGNILLFLTRHDSSLGGSGQGGEGEWEAVSWDSSLRTL